MNPDFWRERWALGQTAFHEETPNVSLLEHLDVLGLGEGKQVFVPLCGKTTDLTVLAQTGAEVVGSELVEDAAAQFFSERGVPFERIPMRPDLVRVGMPGLSILAGDFFTLSPSEVGHVDAVYDRAALVALPPDLRERYAQHLARLAPAATALVITFEHDLPNGPPFSIDRAELIRCYGDALEAPPEKLGERDVYEPGGGLAARGATFVREVAWRLVLRG